MRTELAFSRSAAPRGICGRRHPCGLACARARQRFGRRPVRFPVRRRPETADAASSRAGELLRRSVRHQSASPSCAARAARRGLRTCVLRAKLRRQIFSADHARQRLAGSDLPGVLPGKRHQGVLRQQHRQRCRGQWRALCRQRKRLCLSQGAARRLHLQRPKPVRAGAGRSHARHLAALRRRRRHHRRPGGLYRRSLRRRPDRGIHPRRLLSRPHGRCPRPARRNEGGAGQRRDGRGQRAAARDATRRRAADAPRYRRPLRRSRRSGRK